MGVVEEYFSRIVGILERVVREEADRIREAARVFAEAIRGGGVIHVVGAGHSAMAGEELFYRAGGLAPVNPIIDADITVAHGALRSTLLEGVVGYAEALLRSARVRRGDVVVVVSTSGVNVFPVEAALKAREMGARTVAVTSVSYSSSLKPRNPWGKRLYEVAEVVLDNKVPPGDAVLEVEGVPVKVAPVSTIANSFILNLVAAEAARLLAEWGLEPPVWISSHLPGAEEHNSRLFERYHGRIRLL